MSAFQAAHLGSLADSGKKNPGPSQVRVNSHGHISRRFEHRGRLRKIRNHSLAGFCTGFDVEQQCASCVCVCHIDIAISEIE